MRNLLKPSCFLTILTGAAVGVVLFVLGNAEDAPGLCLMGIVFAFLMIMWGTYNAGMIDKKLIAPIIMICFGTGGLLLTIVLFIDGELEQMPQAVFFGTILGIILIGIGAYMLRNYCTKKR